MKKLDILVLGGYLLGMMVTAWFVVHSMDCYFGCNFGDYIGKGVIGIFFGAIWPLTWLVYLIGHI